MVYASLEVRPDDGRPHAVAGGLWFDSLSANPLGVSVLPLFAVGLCVHLAREFVLRDQPAMPRWCSAWWPAPPPRP